MAFILADIGVPMIMLQFPAMIFALVPVIIIEALFASRMLCLQKFRAFRGAGLANIFSTIAGVPLAWFVMVLIMLATTHGYLYGGRSPLMATLFFLLNIAWLSPDQRNLYWMVPSAMALLLIPSFFVSVWLELWVCRQVWNDLDRALVRRVVFKMNLASYALLFLAAGGWLAYAVLTGVR